MKSSKRRQAGGTLVGFVVGLLVGLGIALSIAVYVTRVPVPFVDRGVSRSPAQDAEEAERNKGWNPNASLAGKPAPLPSFPSTTTTATTTVAADTVTAAPTARSAPDPLGDLVNAKLGTSTASVSPDKASSTVADPFLYFVQAGAFRTPEEADAQRAKLAMLGMSADVTEREQSGRTVFRVRIGPFHDKPLADATREQLVINGVEAALVRVNR
jgi:cell division protein FtsN